MQERFINTEEAPNKWWAAQDARMRSAANKTHFTNAQQVQAERMRQVLELVYAGRFFEPKYNKTCITIKIEGALVRDKKSLAMLEADWDKLGIKKRQSLQGVNYNIPKL
jgi:hypothetical protein